MHWCQCNGRLDIMLDSGESMSRILDAILFASYELAKPTLLGRMYYLKNQSLSTGQLREQRRPYPRRYDGLIAQMMYVNGRQCRTTLYVKSDRHLQLDLVQYATFRDDLNEMLALAQVISESDEVLDSPSSSFEESLVPRISVA